MRIVQFQGSTSQEVLTRVRRELGPHALIVSTDEQNGCVTMTAAIDRFLQPLCAQETYSEIKKCLIHHRTPRPVIEHLLGHGDLEGSMPQVMARVLGEALHAPSLQTVLNEGEPIIVVGPPGVGKTLALVKLAAQCVMESRPVKILSTDRQKSGGCAQIEHLAAAIEAPMSVIENPSLLHREVEAIKEDTLLLIDSPGTNPFDQEQCDRLHQLVTGLDARVVLVMPARGDHEFCDEMEAAFQCFGTEYLVLTQLDLTPRLGPVITRALDSPYPLLAVGKNPEVGSLLVPTKSSGFTSLFIDSYDQHMQTSLLQPTLRSA